MTIMSDAHVRNVDVKHFRIVQVNAMEAALWTIDDLQSLAFFDGQIDSDGPINEIPECLKEFQPHKSLTTSL